MLTDKLRSIVALALGLLLVGCASSRDRNPAAPGFRAADSDPRAIAIADEVMEAMGGREAWDDTRCIAWNFFGRRRHVWDKATGDYLLVDGPKVVRMNLDTMKGRVWIDGQPSTTAVADELARAKSIWINDSYWLVMPYKLKDAGVALGYKGEDRLADGRAADVIVLTFEQVGDTPQNKYEVWVSRDRKLVERWAYFENAGDAEPKLVTEWGDWARYGSILLSSKRTDERRITDIAVHDEPPRELVER